MVKESAKSNQKSDKSAVKKRVAKTTTIISTSGRKASRAKQTENLA